MVYDSYLRFCKIVFLKNLYSIRALVVSSENHDCVPREPRLCSRITYIMFPGNLDYVPEVPRLCSQRTQIVFLENQFQGAGGVDQDLSKSSYNGRISLLDLKF